MTAWRGGDVSAGEALLARYFERLYRFFRHKCGDDDADELVQTTMLACLAACDQFRGGASFGAYVFAIARQKLHRHFTTRGRFDPMVSSVIDLAPSARTVLARGEEQAALIAALQQLPLDWQTMLELHYWEGMDTNDLAIVFDVPPGTVRVWMHRARVKLRALLTSLELSRHRS